MKTIERLLTMTYNDFLITPDAYPVSPPEPKQYCSEDCDTCRVPLNKCPGSYDES